MINFIFLYFYNKNLNKNIFFIIITKKSIIYIIFRKSEKIFYFNKKLNKMMN